MAFAIIPARGGSKRIPRKNIKMFHGLPMIAHAINKARDSGLFSNIIVSTDDEEIARVAQSFGASVPWKRPPELSGDFTTTIEVMQHAVHHLNIDNLSTEDICCIYPTSPLIQFKHLAEGLRILQSETWNYVVSAVRVSENPSRYFYLDSNQKVKMYFPENEQVRTQDTSKTFRDAGQFYWGKGATWADGVPLFASNSTILEIPAEFGVDIDTLEDWNYVEELFKRIRSPK